MGAKAVAIRSNKSAEGGAEVQLADGSTLHADHVFAGACPANFEYIYIYMYICTYTYIYIYVCVCVCVFIWIYMCLYVYILIYLYIHVLI